MQPRPWCRAGGRGAGRGRPRAGTHSCRCRTRRAGRCRCRPWARPACRECTSACARTSRTAARRRTRRRCRCRRKWSLGPQASLPPASARSPARTAPPPIASRGTLRPHRGSGRAPGGGGAARRGERPGCEAAGPTPPPQRTLRERERREEQQRPVLHAASQRHHQQAAVRRAPPRFRSCPSFGRHKSEHGNRRPPPAQSWPVSTAVGLDRGPRRRCGVRSPRVPAPACSVPATSRRHGKLRRQGQRGGLRPRGRGQDHHVVPYAAEGGEARLSVHHG